MLKPRAPDGDFVTKELATYPSRLNARLARAFAEAIATRRVASLQSRSMILTGRWNNVLVWTDMAISPLGPGAQDSKVTAPHALCDASPPPPRDQFGRPVVVFKNLLRPGGQQVSKSTAIAAQPHLGGLRHGAKSLAQVPGHLLLGPRIRATWLQEHRQADDRQRAQSQVPISQQLLGAVQHTCGDAITDEMVAHSAPFLFS